MTDGKRAKFQRERVELKSGKSSREESYYLTNEVGNYEELAQAVRTIGKWKRTITFEM